MAGEARIVDVGTLLQQRKLGFFNYRLIVLSWLITVFDGFDMMMVSFTAPYMRDEFGLSTGMLGAVFSMGMVGMMLGGFFFAYLGDKIGRRPTIIAAAAAFGVLTTATALAPDFHTLLVLRALDGFAIGGMLPLAWALNIEFVPTRIRSTVVTLIMIGYSLGTSVAGPVTNWLAPDHGWRAVYLFGGVGTLACVVLLFFYLPESVRFQINRGRRPEQVARTLNAMDKSYAFTADDRFMMADEVATPKDFRVSALFIGRLKVITPLLWLGYIMSSLAIYFTALWSPIIFEELHFARGTAATAASIGGLLGAGAGLLLMRFTDHFGPRTVVFYPVLLVFLLLTLGFGGLSPAWFLPLATLAIALVSGEHFGVISIAGIFYPSAIRASGAGWATSIAKIGAILGPLLGAAVLSSGMQVIHSYALLALCPAILAVCAIGIAIAARKTEPVAPVILTPSES